jgi:hypothetical protein
VAEGESPLSAVTPSESCESADQRFSLFLSQVVHLEAPRFAPRTPIESEAYLAEHAAAMNDDQQAAVRKVR